MHCLFYYSLKCTEHWQYRKLSSFYRQNPIILQEILGERRVQLSTFKSHFMDKGQFWTCRKGLDFTKKQRTELLTSKSARSLLFQPASWSAAVKACYTHTQRMLRLQLPQKKCPDLFKWKNITITDSVEVVNRPQMHSAVESSEPLW